MNGPAVSMQYRASRITAAEIIAALACGQACCAPAQRRGAGNVHCPVTAHGGDSRPSLAVQEPNGTVLVHCHGGCDQDAVLATLRERGLWNGTASARTGPPASGRPRELSTVAAIAAPEPEVPDIDEQEPNAVHDLTAPRPRELPKVAAIYPYPGIDGIARYRVVRYADPKRFEVWHANGSGWKRGLGGAELVPYRLPQIASARPDVPVFVGEGEKVVDRLVAHGLVATTNPFGAGKWRAEWGATYLGGRRVVVLPDNDDIGRRHAVAVADSCVGPAASVRILALDGLAEHGDVVDWLDAGHGVAELVQLAEAAPEHRRAPVARIEFPCTDMGNAERLVTRHGADLRYVAAAERWHVYDGRRWRRDDTAEVERRAKETARSIYAEAEAAGGAGQRKDLAAHAIRTEGAARRAAMIDTARSDAMIAVRADQFDANPWLLNVANGTVDLRTGVLRPHSRDDLITKVAPVDYDPDAQLDLFDTFVAETFGGDPELMRFVQTAAGYSLTGDTREEVLFFAHGPEAAGKSTFVESLGAALGDYAMTADFDAFLPRKEIGGPRNDIARLHGARLVSSIEVDEGKRLAEGLVKMITGGDTIAARFLHREFFQFRPSFKLWLAANHAPRVNDDDEAMWRRILRIPFTHSVPKEKRDTGVKRTLTDPAIAGAAVLAWAVRGCMRWQHEGLAVPKVVEAATEVYRADMDPLADFIDERCVVDPDRWVTVEDLYAVYAQWARTSGERWALSKKAFGNRLDRRGIPAGKGTHGVRIRRGLGLREQPTLASAGRDDDDRAEVPW